MALGRTYSPNTALLPSRGYLPNAMNQSKPSRPPTHKFLLAIPLPLGLRLEEYCNREQLTYTKAIRTAMDAHLTREGYPPAGTRTRRTRKP